jgi:hypothetical protein
VNRATAAVAAASALTFIAFLSAEAFLILSPVGTAPLRRVLVVDDDDDIRLLLEELLRSAGYAVATAKDGRLALRTFYESRTGSRRSTGYAT